MNSRVLSDKEIQKYLGKKIYIWPFSVRQLKSSTYNLTASPVAFYEKKDEHGKSILKNLITEDDLIKIPPHSTALIQTNESIYVTGDICGTYHSRVGLVKKGLGHIGTTLDPHYFGTSLIAVQNISDNEEYIAVNEEFVSLMFYKLSKKSKQLHDNPAGRTDLYSSDSIVSFEHISDQSVIAEKKAIISQWKSKPWRKTSFELEKIVKRALSELTKNKFVAIVSLVCTILQVLVMAGLIVFGFLYDFTGKDNFFKIYIVLIGALPQAIGWIKELVNSHIIKGRYQELEGTHESDN